MPAIVGQKGQIVIEKAIRDALHIEPGYIAVQRLIDGRVELFFYPPEHNRSLKGILADKIQKRPETQDWAEIRQAAWAQAAVESWIEENRQHDD
jgi:bifunctional DNA-binding transcriptional regulator/antitoxin component of YhaV-PrlF toxin-antitoxin module